MIDYQAIVNELKDEDIFNLLDQLGGEPIDKGDYILSRTICHHEDPSEAKYKLYYYKDSHLFYCYSEDGGMSIFKFLKNYYECRQIIYDWYNDIYKVVIDCSSYTARKQQFLGYKSQRDKYDLQKNRQPLKSYDEGLLEVFTKFYPVEWINDGITKSSMDKYNILYSQSQNKIIIPHYDIDNRLIGIRGRALSDQDIIQFGKYMPVQIEGNWYSHPLSLNLYGLNKNWKNIRETGFAFICESEKSVLQAESFSIKNCVVAACGSNINKFQIDLLMRYCAPHEIVICFDNEELSRSEKYFNKLWKIGSKYTNYCNISIIYDRDNITPLKASPTDCGEEKFRTLLRERVKIE